MSRIVLCIVILLWCVPNAWAGPCDYVKIARISSTLNIRSGASTSYKVLGGVPNAVCLKVLAKTTTGQSISGNRTWYKITYKSITGWISGHYADCSNCGTPPGCTQGTKRACYTGSPSTRKKGNCRDGTQTCSGGKWGSCAGQVGPSSERCDGKDNDCDGQTDEGNPDGGKSCKGSGSGPCAQGTSKCQSGRIVCITSSKPSTETCDGKDNDCDGVIDEGLERSCYGGPANTNGVGVCKGGRQICTGGKWGNCIGEVKPITEACNNARDDDCDGQTDEGCTSPGTCKEGMERACYTGPANTNGVGTCKGGKQKCQGGKWSSCQGSVVPVTEKCGNQTDEDCDGQVDEGCPAPGKCVDQDGDGFGIGTGCKQDKDCDDNNRSVFPGAEEICGNGKDDDCKGGDQPCGKLGVGAEGCRKPEDCISNVCVKLQEFYRCSKRCTKKEDCPADFSCLGSGDQKACWPNQKKVIGKGDHLKKCENGACASGFTCDKGFCVEDKGCGCQSDPKNATGNAIFLLFFGLFLLWGRIRRRNSGAIMRKS